jgi:hypothetical protein
VAKIAASSPVQKPEAMKEEAKKQPNAPVQKA